MGKLAVLKGLRVLDLSETQLTAAGLAVLAQLPAVQSVALYRCAKLDDKAVPVLSGLKSVRWLDLNGTKITEAGAAQIRAALPSTQVLWEP